MKAAFPEREHSPSCPWWHDWHACSCGMYDVPRLETLSSRIADQLDAASVVLRQSPVTVADLVRVARTLRAEAELLELVARRAVDARRPDV